MSQLSGNCDVIDNRLWRHQQNINRESGKRRQCMRIAVFIVIDWFVCRVRNKIIHVLEWRTVYVLTPVLFGVYFIINIKLTLSWAQKQFVTQEHVLFSMFCTCGPNVVILAWMGTKLPHGSGMILGLRPANERRRYFVTTSLIGWAQA